MNNQPLPATNYKIIYSNIALALDITAIGVNVTLSKYKDIVQDDNISIVTKQV